MVVQITSIDAYYTDKERLELVREGVLRCIKYGTQPSSRDIARWLDTERTTITGRLRELETDGLIYKAGQKTDPFTHKRVYYYKLKEVGN